MEQGMRFAYDEEGDVLDISLGRPRKAISKEIVDDFFVRTDPRSGKIIGFSILNFEKGFSSKNERVIPMRASFALGR